MANETTATATDVWYDYDNQAWVENGKYVACGHPQSMNCKCYGRIHAGETAPIENRDRD